MSKQSRKIFDEIRKKQIEEAAANKNNQTANVVKAITEPKAKKEPIEKLSGRSTILVFKSLHDRLKEYSVKVGRQLYDVTDEALKEFMKEKRINSSYQELDKEERTSIIIDRYLRDELKSYAAIRRRKMQECLHEAIENYLKKNNN